MAVSTIPMAHSELKVGQIQIWSGATAPPRWLICNGAVIDRATYSELFDVISTTYGGGDGSTTFAIPDLKGRTAIGVGENSAAGHSSHTLGQYAGEEKHTLTASELASHGTSMHYGRDTSGGWNYVVLASQQNITTESSSGCNNTPHNTMQPFVTMNYIIYTGVE